MPAMGGLEWCDTYAVVRVGGDRCALEATTEALNVRIEAADEDGLRRLQDMVTRRLETIGSRDQLKVNWEEPLVLTSINGEGGTATAGLGEGAAGSGRSRRTALVGGVGVVALALHMFGGMFMPVLVGLLAWRWASNIAVGVVALVVLKLVMMAAGALFVGRIAGRRVVDRLPPAAAHVLGWVLR